MKSLVSTIAFLALASMANVAHSAGGLIQKLPKDGEWVSYYFEMKGKARQQEQTMTGTFTIKSVGSVMENGEKCRWIEIEMKGEEGGKKRSHLSKILVREKDFAPGSKNLGRIVRGWKRSSAKAQLKELTENEKSGSGDMAMLIGGKLSDEKVLKTKKVVDYQKGQLKIAQGTTGKFEMKMPGKVPKDFKYDMTQSVWPHKNVPFGIAVLEINMKLTVKEMVVMNMKMTFTLQNQGVGAKSQLPDKK
jgi:hypothetical protein